MNFARVGCLAPVLLGDDVNTEDSPAWLRCRLGFSHATMVTKVAWVFPTQLLRAKKNNVGLTLRGTPNKINENLTFRGTPSKINEGLTLRGTPNKVFEGLALREMPNKINPVPFCPV
jgi:hypothetical protein